MRSAWSRRRPPLPDGVRVLLDLRPGERVLEWTTDVHGALLVASTTHLYAVSAPASAPPPAPSAGTEPDRTVLLRRPWHLVDAGRWNAETSSLSVTWVDGERRGRWALDDGGGFLQALRERVQASVVLGESVDIGPGRTARVVVRRDLADGRLLGQTILGRGVSREDPAVRMATEAALAGLREQVGLD